MAPARRQRWRVQGIFPDIDQETLTRILRDHYDLKASLPKEDPSGAETKASYPQAETYRYVDNGADILTLARKVSEHNPLQVATVKFAVTPDALRQLSSGPTAVFSIDYKLSDARNMRLAIDKGFLGLTVLVSPDDEQYWDSSLNILAISGLGSHPIGSFISKEDGHLWLSDSLPSDLPRMARIMVYGYDSVLRRSKSRASIDSIASTFLPYLYEILEMHKSTVPLILIGHSLGGIIIKEALIQLANSKGTSTLLKLVSAVLFHGVPHDGMDIESFRAAVGDHPNQSLLISLDRKNSDLLEAQRTNFLDQFLNTTTSDVFCFYETRDSPTGKLESDGTFQVTGPPDCLVSKTSATNCFRPGTPSAASKIAVDKTHSELVKFSEHDPGYQNVRSILLRLCNDHLRVQKPPADEQPTLARDQRQNLLDSLQYNRMNDRRMNIKDPHKSTCTWLFDSVEYHEWLDDSKIASHHGLLWIKGNPGSGKSTLMKLAAAKAPNGYMSVAFFFNARGFELEKSAEGMYRSILHQLLLVLSPQELYTVLDSAGLDAEEFAKNGATPVIIWEIPLLQALLQAALRRLSGEALVLYIDALDECDTNEIRNVVSFFEDLCSEALEERTNLRICFASRHYPNVTIERARYLILDRQDGHTQDIVKYLNARLKIGKSSTAHEVRRRLLDKASGIFMWIVLVTAMLNKKYDRGRDSDLLKTLDTVPNRLSDLFREIVNSKDYLDEEEDGNRNYEYDFACCINLVLWAARSLEPLELCDAIEFSASGGEISNDRSNEFPKPAQKRYILDVSKGLVEVTDDKRGDLSAPTVTSVQFIHEAVRDFLLGRGGLSDIVSHLGDHSGPHLEGANHQHLSRLCLDYMFAVDAFKSSEPYLEYELHLNEPAARFDAEEVIAPTKLYPFSDYAAENVLVHADLSAKCGLDQTEFLTTFPVASWVPHRNQSARWTRSGRSATEFSSRVTLLYVLAYEGLSSLTQQCPRNEACFEEEYEEFRAPILAALGKGNNDTVQTLLQIRVAACPEHYPPSSPLYAFYKEFRGRTTGSVTNPYTFAGSVLDILRDNQYVVAAVYHPRALLEEEINKRNSHGRTHIHNMVTLIPPISPDVFKSMVAFMSAKGADLDIADHDGNTSILSAAKAGLFQAVGFLIDQGAQVDLPSAAGRTVLSYAASAGHVETVERLIGKSDFNSVDGTGWTPLFHAVEKGFPLVVDLLVNNGAQLEITDKSGRTPLFYAVKRRSHGRAPPGSDPPMRYFHCARILITAGAQVDSTDNEGYTPLSLAAGTDKWSDSLVDLLIGAGANTRFQVSLFNNLKPRKTKSASWGAAERSSQQTGPVLEPWYK